MTATEQTFTVDEALPRIAAVSPHEGMHIAVTWADGPRAPRTETVDLAPAVLRFKIYAPLRSDPDLFRSVHVSDDGFAIAWGSDDGIDMASTTVEELAERTMAPADFAAFVKRHGYTLDSIAAELGISRRQAAYFQSAKAVPRAIALACAYLDDRAKAKADAVTPNTSAISGSYRGTAVGFSLNTKLDFCDHTVSDDRCLASAISARMTAASPEQVSGFGSGSILSLALVQADLPRLKR